MSKPRYGPGQNVARHDSDDETHGTATDADPTYPGRFRDEPREDQPDDEHHDQRDTDAARPPATDPREVALAAMAADRSPMPGEHPHHPIFVTSVPGGDAAMGQPTQPYRYRDTTASDIRGPTREERAHAEAQRRALERMGND